MRMKKFSKRRRKSRKLLTMRRNKTDKIEKVLQTPKNCVKSKCI
jgi:hypothetical protein